MKANSVSELEFDQAVARMRKHRAAARKRLKHTLSLAKVDDRRVMVGVTRNKAVVTV